MYKKIIYQNQQGWYFKRPSYNNYRQTKIVVKLRQSGTVIPGGSLGGVSPLTTTLPGTQPWFSAGPAL